MKDIYEVRDWAQECLGRVAEEKEKASIRADEQVRLYGQGLVDGMEEALKSLLERLPA